MANISTDAKHGFEAILSSCLHASLRLTGSPEWTLRPTHQESDILEEEFYMLTVSSYTFRIFVLLHFNNDENTRSYVSRALNLENNILQESRYFDFLGEVGNNLCGSFKREIGKHFPHTGMSTPNRLAAPSLPYLQKIAGDYFTHINACDEISKSRFVGSIYISAFSDIDFKAEPFKPNNSVDTGALELF